jgi:hypothetical protein
MYLLIVYTIKMPKYSIDKFLTDFIYYDFSDSELDQSNYSTFQMILIALSKLVLTYLLISTLVNECLRDSKFTQFRIKDLY